MFTTIAFDNSCVELRGGDGALLARLDEARTQLLPVEGLAAPVVLDHHVGDLFDRLVGSEAAAARDAFAAAADDLSLASLSRIDDAIVTPSAERTFHWRQSIKGNRVIG